MEAGRRIPKAKPQPGVSVITCTNRHSYLKNLFHNFTRQLYPMKELIIVVNNDGIPLEPYLRMAKKWKTVRVFRAPGAWSLGACINFAAKKAKYAYIAKFDDDDYYAPYYLTASLQVMHRSRADVIGKRAHYMYLNGSKTLILRFPGDENRIASRLPGATLVFRKAVIERVPFPERNVGEDDVFCLRCRKKGFKVYSGEKSNFVAIRRKNSQGHTWIISEQELIAHHRTIPNVRNFKKFVQRKPKGVL
ncbi:glycosyl transferase [Paenibacillus sp. HMSSN-139]|jgi:GT2 family glycosyltransferase|nr:glycosyl transferase [Paenibacillus sp. HMSSN-139]